MAGAGGGAGGPGGGVLAVAANAYSPQAAVAILARELPQEDPASLNRIHNEIQDLITPMVDTFPLKRLARGLLGISDHMFPDSFLLVTPMAEKLLADHVHAILHDAMPPHLRFDIDWESGVSWAVFRNHVLDAKADLAALALMHGNVAGMAGEERLSPLQLEFRRRWEEPFPRAGWDQEELHWMAGPSSEDQQTELVGRCCRRLAPPPGTTSGPTRYLRDSHWVPCRRC